jgi:hypothetical protein
MAAWTDEWHNSGHQVDRQGSFPLTRKAWILRFGWNLNEDSLVDAVLVAGITHDLFDGVHGLLVVHAQILRNEHG